VGVDVMQLSERPRRREQDPSSEHFFRAFTDHFTPLEWQYIHRASNDDARFHAFYRLWSLKEAYIKAIGIGLGFELLRAEFTSIDASETEWSMRLDGVRASGWTFRSVHVQGSTNREPHVISIALGPVAAIWNANTSSIFPLDQAQDSAASTTEFPGDSQWQEKTLDDLLQI
jgi:4'-phosphopantetheinyl transferase